MKKPTNVEYDDKQTQQHIKRRKKKGKEKKWC